MASLIEKIRDLTDDFCDYACGGMQYDHEPYCAKADDECRKTGCWNMGNRCHGFWPKNGYTGEELENMSELKDTVDLMLSTDHRDRFLGEIEQLRIRKRKLADMLLKWDHLDFTPNCPRALLEKQLQAMDEYLHILVERMLYEFPEDKR